MVEGHLDRLDQRFGGVFEKPPVKTSHGPDGLAAVSSAKPSDEPTEGLMLHSEGHLFRQRGRRGASPTSTASMLGTRSPPPGGG